MLRGMDKKMRACFTEDQVGCPADPNQGQDSGTTARAGLALGILAVVLAIGIYFVLANRLAGLARDLAELPAQVAALGTRMDGLDAKVAVFDQLPDKVRRQLVADRLAEMALTAKRLSAGVDSPEQKALLAKIEAMTQALRTDVTK